MMGFDGGLSCACAGGYALVVGFCESGGSALPQRTVEVWGPRQQRAVPLGAGDLSCAPACEYALLGVVVRWLTDERLCCTLSVRFLVAPVSRKVLYGREC